MAGFTGHASLPHGGVIGVAGLVIIFSQPGIVASGTHGIPVHAPSAPMSPFTRLPIFLTEDIEPFPGARVICRLHRLPAAAGRAYQKLPQRVVTDNAFHLMFLGISRQPAAGDVIGAIDRFERRRLADM